MPWSAHHRRHRHKNLTLLLVGFIVAYFLGRQPWFHDIMQYVASRYDVLGAVIGGMLFVSTFTIGIGGVILFDLGKTMPIWQLALVGGVGEVIGDLLIFHFVRDDIVSEIKPMYKKLGGNHLSTILHTRYFSWTLPVLGALIMASPFPDELGITLLGISTMSRVKFMFLSYVLGASGIFIMMTATRALM